MGIQLNLTPSDLDGIEHRRGGNTLDCYSDVFEKWIQAGDSVTWRTIIRALKSPILKNNDLAERIETKYCSVDK